MLLMRVFIPLASALALLTSLELNAQETDWQLKSNIYTGLDAWHIGHRPQNGPLAPTVFMPDSSTRWAYREVSPWYVIQATMGHSYRAAWVFKARANQSVGAKVDQLYYDHALSPRLGFRVGVVDYRATWCRVYDLDDPWVREADPFCSDKTIKLATASAPGLQAYSNMHWDRYQVQLLAGLYQPKLFSYEPQEFSDLLLLPDDRVTHNNKIGLTLNAIELRTSTEWRISWIYADQSARLAPSSFNPNPAKIDHAVHLWFAGVSWQVSPRTRARLTHMRSDLRGTLTEFVPNQPDKLLHPRVIKQSTVLELNYQHSPVDIWSISVSQYPFVERGAYEWKHRAVSLGWRRDWSRQWFTAVQLTHAKNQVPYSIYPDFVPAGQHSASGVGFRLGFKL